MSSSRLFRWRFLLIASVPFALHSSPGWSQTAQEKNLYDQLFAICNNPANFPPFGPNDQLVTMCNNVFVGGLAGGTFSPGSFSTNVGGAGSYGAAGQAAARQQQRDVDGLLEDEEKKRKKKKGAGSGDFTAGPFGGFVAIQSSGTKRDLTELENGYDAKLKGVLVGLDRRFGNDLVVGASLGHTKTENDYLGNSGRMDAKNTTFMAFATYLPSPGSHLGGYVGAGRGEQDVRRTIRLVDPATSIVILSGDVTSNNDVQQRMAGFSGGREWSFGSASLGLQGAVDYVQNTVGESTEAGSTLLELIYPEQTMRSLTASLGARLSNRYAVSWGAVVPSVRAAYFHEFRDDARTLQPRLVVRPNLSLSFRTDEPDRNYYVGGAGLTFETGRGTQFFVDYERRAGHAFIQTWAASVGVLAEF